MSSDFDSRDDLVERGSIPLDIDNVHMLLQVEQEQIQKKTFTNWVNAQLAKRRPPCMVLDLFNDFRDGSKLLDLLEVMSGQRLSRERGRGMFQHRSNIEKALSFLKQKSIKLVNIHIPDIIDGKPSIILGLIWTIILQYHIEELASSLSFSSRQSSMESLASLDSRSTLSSRSASSSPLPPRGSPLHNRFRVSARKALLLWVREQCHKAGCSINVKDFKASWRSGVVFLAIQYALHPDLVDLSKARTRSNKQNLEEAFHIAEKELRIPRLLDPDDVDVRDPDEKSIMTYVAQFLQYSKDLPVPEEETQTPYLTLPKSPSPINLPVHYTPAISASPLRQATPNQKAKEVTCWLVQAYDELLEGWDSTEGESYSERYHVFQTFLVSFNEQRRPIMPLLTAMRRTSKLSEEQQSLREAWDTLTDKLREYKVLLDMSLPAPLDAVAHWLLKTEKALAEEEGEPQDHGRAADDAREKQELLRACPEEMPQHVKTFQSFQNLDEYGNMMVPTDKMEELKRRFTSVRVTVKYHGIKLEYREHKHTVLDLLGQIRTKLRLWKRPYISPEAVRVLLQEWHDVVNTQELPSLLEAALHKLKQVSEKYSRKSALAADYHQVSQQVKQLEEDTAQVLEEVTTAKSTLGRVLLAWDSYSDDLSSLQAWLEQGSSTHSHGHRPLVTSESLAEWGSRQAHLNEVGNFLMEAADPQTSRSLAEELCRLNMRWAEFNKRNTFDSTAEPSADIQTRPQDIQALIREATLILKEPLETMAGPLRTYRKRLELLMRKIKEVDLEALAPSQECPADQLQKLKLAIPEVMQTLFEAEHVCTELQHSVSGLDSRLAELLHWETEARELYQLLRAAERQKQRGQDPRARVLISRGLQLEGQVVTEEQDLQVMVMTTQKNSPIQYLHASAMQDRVRAAVAQSQEAVGMLSSLGARRDRSRSPPEGSPPSKVYKQAEEKPQNLRQSDTLRWLTQQPKTKLVSHHETFVPKIVVQEYREEKVTSPSLPYTYAQAVMQTRTKSPPEDQAQAWPETVAQKQQTQKQGLIQQQQLLQQEQLKRQPEKELQQQELKQQHPQDVQQQGVMQTQPQQLQQKQNQQQVEQHVEMHQYQVQQQVVSDRQTSEPHKQTSLQQPPVKKPHISSQELQSRKTQAMKNRPWLQKHKTPDPEQDSTQEPILTRQTQPQSDRETAVSVQVVPQHTASARPQPEAHAKDTKQPPKQQKEQQKETQQPQTLKQQQQEYLQHQQQQQKEKHQQQQPQRLEKQQKQQEQLLQQQQEKQPQQAQPDTDTKAKSQTITMAQPHPQTKAQNQIQPQTMVQSKSQAAFQVQVQSTSLSHTTTDGQQPLKTISQNRVSHSQSQTNVLPQPHGAIKTQSLTQPQNQLQPQVQTQSQTCVPAGPQLSMQPQGLALSPAVAQVQTWAQVRPSSPIQAPLQGQIQPPVPSHIQLRSHPQSWAPVRPPSPKPPTHTHIQTHPQPKTQSQIHAQSTAQAQTHAQSMAQVQTHPQPKAHPQTHPQPMAHPQTHVQSMAQVQTHPQPKAHPQTHTQSMVQAQIHAQPVARPSHAQPSTQNQTHAQLVVQPQGHSQPMIQYATHGQPEVQHPGHISQGQIHAWSQVRVSSPMSVQHPQATAQSPLYPQGYSHGQSSSQQWTPKQEPQNQAIAQQRHPIPQPYPQQICQAPQCQAYSTLQALPQWPQAGPQQGPQVGPPMYSHMGPSFPQPQMQTQTQPWAQTQPQMRPQSSMQQQPQMTAYNMLHIQMQQSQVQQQTWVQAQPQLQPQPYAQPQSQQYSQVQHQTQHHPQPQMQAQISPQSQPPHQAHPQLPSQLQLHPQLQDQSQTHNQTQSWVQGNPQAQTRQPQLNLLFQQPPTQSKHQVQLQPQPNIQSPTQPKVESHPQSKPVAQLAPQPGIQSPTQPKVQSSTQAKEESLPQALLVPQFPPQPMAQSKMKAELPPQPKPQAQTAPLLEAQSPTLPKVQSPTQPKAQSPPQPKPQAQPAPLLEAPSPTLPKVQSPTQPRAQSPPQAQTAPLLEAQSPTLPRVQSPTQPKAKALPQPKPQAQLPPQPQLQAQSLTLPKAQTEPESKAQSPPQAKPQLPQSKPQTQSPPQPKPQQSQTILLSQVNVLPQSLAESPDLCIKPLALAQVPPQAYTEAYSKAQALARNGFEEAKHCLQEHILETINVFKDKSISAEQASVKEETLKTLDPELLEEFLRAAKGMEAFCTPSQLSDMELFTQSVRTQWEACFSAEGSFAQAGQHLEALKELCDTLSPEDAHRLAQTQLRECETRLAAIQRQFSGDQDAPLPDSRIPVAFSEDLTTQNESTRPSDKPHVSTEVLQVTVNTLCVERREVEKQASVEEEVTKKEALERYENCKRSLQTQLAKNEQSIKDVPSDSISLKGLHTRLQEIQFLRQETESLWSEYANQCSQLSRNTGLEQGKAELQEQWRCQQSKLQRMGSSLGAALRQIDSTENHMVDFTDRLDRYLRQPKDITAFTLANTNILKDIKELDDNIQSELDQLSRLDPDSSDLDPRDCFPLSRELETHRTSLDQLRQQVRKSEAAARALDRFLMSLRTVDEDISGVQGAPCRDTVILQDCRSKLALIRQSIDSLKEKAPQLDVLLQGARLTVTRDGVPASCLDMVTALLRRLEEADSRLASQQKGLQKETQSKSLGLRKRTLLGELRKLQDTIETQGVKEPTIHAVQHSLRALSDLEGQLQAQHAELQNLLELQEKQGGGEHFLQELETQWKDTQTAFFDRKKQCSILLELLKKFQSCRSHLSNTMQKAEQSISDQASYLGKGNLQRSITTVCDIKAELAGIGERMEEMRSVCRQLQSQLKKFPDCRETPFEAEADTLMDNWLDVTEKTDAYMDNLRVGVELWDKQLMLGGEVDRWAGAKLALFAESHPFHNKQQVLAMRDEIHVNEENIEHFHKKSAEIQEMLQSREAPLELQVMETQLRKRMEQVKELFADCTDVFEELMAVKKHLAENIEQCQSAVERIQGSVSNVDSSQPKVEDQLQHLCDKLEALEQQAEAAMKEVGLVSSVASPQVLEVLSVDCSRLKEAICRTQAMIQLKREERDKGLLNVIKDERQSFEDWFQDLQLSVNECFEHPESRADVETSLQRLTDAERRLEHLKVQLERGSQQAPLQQLSEFTDWLKEQQKEVATFRTHCLNRQKQMEPLLRDLNSLQKQHDSFRDWLQNKEKQPVEVDKVKLLLKNLQDESSRAESLSELLASVRRQGVRAESLLKDGDNLIQRYRNLESRLQRNADAQSALEAECDKFNTQAQSTRTWITELLQPLTPSGRDTQTPERKHRAQAILSSKAEGDSKMNALRRQSESLCELEDLQDGRKQEVQQSLRETEEQWSKVLHIAEENLSQAQTQALLGKDLDAVKTQNKNVQSWIRDQEQSMQSLAGCMQVEEKLQIAQAILSSKPDGESKLQCLKQQCQSLCDSQGLDQSSRRDVQDTVRQTEEQWRKVLQAAEDGLNKAQTDAATERDFDAFKSQSESIQCWIKEQKQKLLSLGSHMPFEERLQVAQAVMTSKLEGESKVLELQTQGEGLREHLEESRKPEVQQLVEDTEQQWRALQQAARQAELRSLSDDFDTQSKNTQCWIRDRQQQLQAVGSHTPPDHRCHAAQTILSSKPEGDCTVNNLRRRGQSLCDHQDTDQGRKAHVQKAIRDTEEQWKTILQAAKQVEAAAAAEIAQQTERRASELKEFDTQQQDTRSWLTDLQQRLDSLKSQTKAKDRLHSAQAIVRSKPEGDSRLQELRRRCQSLCGQNLGEPKNQEVQQKVRGAEEQWTRVLQNAKQVLDQAEKRCALEGKQTEYEALRTNTRAWLEDKQRSLVSLDIQTDLEKTINTAQTVLSCKPEGDSRMTELRRQSQILSNLEENTRREVQQTVKDLEEQWRTVLQTAENSLEKADVHYLLSRELEAFHTKAGITQTWVKKLQQQAESKGSGTQGSHAQLEDRLNTAQGILSSKTNGEAQVMELKRRAQSLCEHKDLQGDKKVEVEQTVKDTEQQWVTVLQVAEETQKQLKGVVERLESCDYQRGLIEERLSELQKQTSSLPRVFPWPGLGERRQAVEQARIMLDQSTALAPVLSDLRTQAAELFEITQERSWSELTWAAKQESIPALLKGLTDAVAQLEQGILAERHCTQLVEQHEAAQDWLREHVKGLGAPPADRQGLHSAVNTLKALLQTVDREQREMKELDSARDSLLSLCTPGGRDALTLEISHLHELCATSEQEVRKRLVACETRLEELDGQLARRAKGLKERSAALQWELRSLDQALSYSQPQNNIPQLQQHWHSLQKCEKSLADLGVKVQDLQQEVKATPATDELPTEIMTLVKSLCQQHDSLKSRLSEHQGTCSTNTARCLMDCLHALQEWNHSKPSESISCVQVSVFFFLFTLFFLFFDKRKRKEKPDRQTKGQQSKSS
ncbi:nesprin-2 [Perca flavescens]|uniref:nesprin-2 n=1 Tax=Perca flavescens TaxID=8167 RepID=UPI00106E937C|nr:nesprin-2-like [Perca flavescens]